MTQIIYILTNPTMPGLVKIGHTTKTLKERMRELWTTGVPAPFEIYYACTVDEKKEVEKKLHDAFDDHRVNPKREFFRISPARVASALKLSAIKDVTPDKDCVQNKEERQSLNEEKFRRPNFKFSAVGIKKGAELSFVQDENIKAIVVDDRKISFKGEVTSLSQSALTLLNRDPNKKIIAASGPEYWVFENETLSERRIRFENEDMDNA